MPIIVVVECPGPGEHSALGHNAEPVIPTVYTVISLKTSERIRLLVGCSGLSVRPQNQVSHAGLPWPVGYLTSNLQSPEMLTWLVGSRIVFNTTTNLTIQPQRDLICIRYHVLIQQV